MNTLPIFKFPILVYQEILASMEPGDLAFTGRRTNLNQYKIELKICSEPILSIGSELVTWETLPEEWRYEIEHVRCNGRRIVLNYKLPDLKQYKGLVEYISQLMNCSVNRVVFDTDAFLWHNGEIIDWLATISESFESLEIIGLQEQDGVVAQIARQLRISHNLVLSVKLSNRFQSTLPTSDLQLIINRGKWITLNHLLHFDSKIIMIKEHYLTAENLKSFAQAWVEKRALINLKYFQICLKINEVDPIFHLLETLPSQYQDENLVRWFPIMDGKLKTAGGLDITRVDGIIATLFLRNRSVYQTLLGFCVR